MNKGFIFLPFDSSDEFGPNRNNKNNRNKKYNYHKDRKYRNHSKNNKHKKDIKYSKKHHYNKNTKKPKNKSLSQNPESLSDTTQNKDIDIDLSKFKDPTFKFDFFTTPITKNVDISTSKQKDNNDSQNKEKQDNDKNETSNSNTSNEEKNTQSDSFSFILPLDNDIKFKKPENNNNLFSLFLPQFNNENKPLKDESENQLKEIKKQRENLINGEPINFSIKNLDSLIELASLDEYKETEKNYNIDIKSLHRMLPNLIELKNLIGMEDIKDKLFLQILFYLQGLDVSNQDLLHTVIDGSPGVGKTELAKILGNIYKSLGILSKGTFTVAKRSDLIGSFLGSTAMKTSKILNESKGGVLFIDEAYSLGNEEGKDIYSKECIDTINQFLSENREDFVCIIAGYRDALENCFFKYNAGLERRFPWRYSIKKYTAQELAKIFEKIVIDNNWKIKLDDDFFVKHLDKFKYFGGDMEVLFHKTKLAHSLRALTLAVSEKKIINTTDLEKGLELFQADKQKKKDDNIYMLYS